MPVVLQVIKQMVSRGILRENTYKPTSKKSASTSHLSYGFNPQQELLAFLLCHFLWPFVDSLWALTNTLFTMQDQRSRSSNGKRGECLSFPCRHIREIYYPADPLRPNEALVVCSSTMWSRCNRSSHVLPTEEAPVTFKSPLVGPRVVHEEPACEAHSLS